MGKIKVQLFGCFSIFVDDREVFIEPSAKEFLALLIVAGGNKVTAKDVWSILVAPSGMKYNATIYTRYLESLQSELNELKQSNLIISEIRPVRSCRLDIEKVECDYYDMLNQAARFRKQNLFLPEYPWSKRLYLFSWEMINAYWKLLHSKRPMEIE